MEEKEYIPMREITEDEYLDFIREKDYVVIGNTKVKLRKDWKIDSFEPSDEYNLKRTTVWNFPERGGWATHCGDYRGNWSPFVPRNLILKYSKKGDWILDQMMGSGTTLIESKLLERNAIGVDINFNSVMIARDRLNFRYESPTYEEPKIKTYVGDARRLDVIEDESIDLILTHPPYSNIISFSSGEKIPGDLSQMSFKEYLCNMRRVAEESLRVLKPGKVCAILIGDTRKHKRYVPISFRVMQAFLDVGFILKEDIIKLQWNMKDTRRKWCAKEYEFYLIAHEHIFVFEKVNGEERKKLKYSAKWW